MGEYFDLARDGKRFAVVQPEVFAQNALKAHDIPVELLE
jgi:hypothetical protein